MSLTAAKGCLEANTLVDVISGPASSKRQGNSLKRFKDFNLKADAGIWP